ncbi:Leucine-rich repeats and immunoglobulin-like domains protein 3, partial [Stegodyphus mimosarum]
MSHNRLQIISSKMFDKLYSLKRLILNDNLITYIEEGAFRSLSALQYLELKNNEVSWTIEDTGKIFAGLVRLKYLGLSNNKIKAIVKRAFTGLSKLETLNMTDNDITTIEEYAFDEMIHLQELYLNTTSLLCDCHLAWMTISFQYGVHAKCGFPEKLRGESVFEVSPSEMLCENSPKPEIIKEPHANLTLKGENVTLECQARSSSSSDIKIHWRKDGKLLHNLRHRMRNFSVRRGNFTVFTSFLNIYNVRDEDEGRYQCVISNHFGSVYSNKTRITVHVFPVFSKTPVDIAIKTGSTARLECAAKGQPRPNILWRKDGGAEDFPAAQERRMHIMPTDDVFFITGVKPSDTGVYSCTAQNVAGTIVANATLTVLETPSFVKKMEDKETRAGETTVLECMAAGSPKPKLTWTKDGGPLYVTERHFFTAENQLLIIVQSQISDSGTYSCEMSNTVGTKRGSSHLKVSPVNGSSLQSSNDENHSTTGIIVIAVVICIVGTSIVWVIFIYNTRKRDPHIPHEDERFSQVPTNSSDRSSDLVPYSTCSGMCPKDLKKQCGRNVFLDTHSGHSKDSGTGDSGQQSSDNLLLEDDHGLLIAARPPSKFGGFPLMGSLRTLQGSVVGSQPIEEPYSSVNNSVSKEQVPLLESFRTSSNAPLQQNKSGCNPKWPVLNSAHCMLPHCRSGKWPSDVTQRSYSAEQLGEAPASHCHCDPPRASLLRTDSDATERDSGFSTFPRSITLASVSNWSGDSPRFLRLPKDIPNDSGSFSIAGDEVQELSNNNRCHSVTILPVHMVASSKSCTGITSVVSVDT